MAQSFSDNSGDAFSCITQITGKEPIHAQSQSHSSAIGNIISGDIESFREVTSEEGSPPALPLLANLKKAIIYALENSSLTEAEMELLYKHLDFMIGNPNLTETWKEAVISLKELLKGIGNIKTDVSE